MIKSEIICHVTKEPEMGSNGKTLLETLKLNERKRSKTGRIREQLHEIEEAQKKGIKNADIVDALNEQGLELSLKTFENILHRLRNEEKKKPIAHVALVKGDVQAEVRTSVKEERKNSAVDYDWGRIGISSQRLIDDLIENEITPEIVASWNCANESAVRKKLTIYVTKNNRRG